MTPIALWLALFGVWPFADPGHDDLGSPLVLLDLALHGAAAGWLAWRRYRWHCDRRIEAAVRPSPLSPRARSRLAAPTAPRFTPNPWALFPREVVHQSPPGDSNVMPCCERSPLDVAWTDRITTDPDRVTCRG